MMNDGKDVLEWAFRAFRALRRLWRVLCNWREVRKGDGIERELEGLKRLRKVMSREEFDTSEEFDTPEEFDTSEGFDKSEEFDKSKEFEENKVI